MSLRVVCTWTDQGFGSLVTGTIGFLAVQMEAPSPDESRTHVRRGQRVHACTSVGAATNAGRPELSLGSRLA